MRDFFRWIVCLYLALVTLPVLAVNRPTLIVTVDQSGRSATLVWDDDINPPETIHYYAYHSMTSGVYSAADRRDTGSNKTFTWDNLPFGTSYFVVTAALLPPAPELESGYSNEVNVVITAPTLILNCSAITQGTVGQAFNATFLASGGVPPYTFGSSSGILPPGLTLDTSTGALSGIPTMPGTYSVSGYVTDSAGSQPGTANCTFTFLPAAPTSLNITSGPVASVIDRRTVRIAWTTSEPADGSVSYWRQNYIIMNVASLALSTDHSFTLTGLQPNQSWQYIVRSQTADERQVSAGGSFSTGR